jgi:hypothetical protein
MGWTETERLQLRAVGTLVIPALGGRSRRSLSLRPAWATQQDHVSKKPTPSPPLPPPKKRKRANE